MGLNIITEEKVSEILGVKLDTVRRWRREDRGPSFLTLGRLIRYDLKVVEAFSRKKGRKK